jgi:hypothetical protein
MIEASDKRRHNHIRIVGPHKTLKQNGPTCTTLVSRRSILLKIPCYLGWHKQKETKKQGRLGSIDAIKNARQSGTGVDDSTPR